MSQDELIQLAVSAAAITFLIGLAAWARISRPQAPLDEAAARRLFDEEFPARSLDGVWIASDGTGAIARSGDQALMLCRVGDGFAARQAPWTHALAGRFRGGRLSIRLADVTAPWVTMRFPAWPPQETAA